MSAENRSDDGAVERYLFGLKPRGKKLGIDRMRPLAAALGHPEMSVPVIHVAGTNGKGSVAAMIEAILRSAGWRVGLYTSPHLVHVGERVQVDRQALTAAAVAAYVRELDPVADRLAQAATPDDRPSFFEFMTAMALLQFQRTACDIAVLEVGLGGEFDATNIVTPELSVITSIALDHCEWLGRTIPEIAHAKAGIIKPGRPVVIGRLPPEAEAVVRHIAASRGAVVHSVREEFGDTPANYPETRLEGEYQRWNAATASLAARALAARWRVGAGEIRRGLREVSWVGRWQRTQVGDRALVLDASHNPEGAAVLDANLAKLVRDTGRQPVVVVGVLGVERAGPLLATISRHAREVILVAPDEPRALAPAELRALMPTDFRGSILAGEVKALFPGGDLCTAGSVEDVVVVTGSIYLLGEVMTRLTMPKR